MATTFARCASGLTFIATWNRETAQRRSRTLSLRHFQVGIQVKDFLLQDWLEERT